MCKSGVGSIKIIEDQDPRKMIKKSGINGEWNVKMDGSNVFARSIHFVAENRIILEAFYIA